MLNKMNEEDRIEFNDRFTEFVKSLPEKKTFEWLREKRQELLNSFNDEKNNNQLSNGMKRQQQAGAENQFASQRRQILNNNNNNNNNSPVSSNPVASPSTCNNNINNSNHNYNISIDNNNSKLNNLAAAAAAVVFGDQRSNAGSQSPSDNTGSQSASSRSHLSTSSTPSSASSPFNNNNNNPQHPQNQIQQHMNNNNNLQARQNIQNSSASQQQPHNLMSNNIIGNISNINNSSNNNNNNLNNNHNHNINNLNKSKQMHHHLGQMGGPQPAHQHMQQHGNTDHLYKPMPLLHTSTPPLQNQHLQQSHIQQARSFPPHLNTLPPGMPNGQMMGSQRFGMLPAAHSGSLNHNHNHQQRITPPSGTNAAPPSLSAAQSNNLNSVIASSQRVSLPPPPTTRSSPFAPYPNPGALQHALPGASSQPSRPGSATGRVGPQFHPQSQQPYVHPLAGQASSLIVPPLAASSLGPAGIQGITRSPPTNFAGLNIQSAHSSSHYSSAPMQELLGIPSKPADVNHTPAHSSSKKPATMPHGPHDIYLNINRPPVNATTLHPRHYPMQTTLSSGAPSPAHQSSRPYPLIMGPPNLVPPANLRLDRNSPSMETNNNSNHFVPLNNHKLDSVAGSQGHAFLNPKQQQELLASQRAGSDLLATINKQRNSSHPNNSNINNNNSSLHTNNLINAIYPNIALPSNVDNSTPTGANTNTASSAGGVSLDSHSSLRSPLNNVAFLSTLANGPQASAMFRSANQASSGNAATNVSGPMSLVRPNANSPSSNGPFMQQSPFSTSGGPSALTVGPNKLHQQQSSTSNDPYKFSEQTSALISSPNSMASSSPFQQSNLSESGPMLPGKYPLNMATNYQVPLSASNALSGPLATMSNMAGNISPLKNSSLMGHSVLKHDSYQQNQHLDVPMDVSKGTIAYPLTQQSSPRNANNTPKSKASNKKSKLSPQSNQQQDNNNANASRHSPPTGKQQQSANEPTHHFDGPNKMAQFMNSAELNDIIVNAINNKSSDPLLSDLTTSTTSSVPPSSFANKLPLSNMIGLIANPSGPMIGENAGSNLDAGSMHVDDKRNSTQQVQNSNLTTSALDMGVHQEGSSSNNNGINLAPSDLVNSMGISMNAPTVGHAASEMNIANARDPHGIASANININNNNPHNNINNNNNGDNIDESKPNNLLLDTTNNNSIINNNNNNQTPVPYNALNLNSDINILTKSITTSQPKCDDNEISTRNLSETNNFNQSPSSIPSNNTSLNNTSLASNASSSKPASKYQRLHTKKRWLIDYDQEDQAKTQNSLDKSSTVIEPIKLEVAENVIPNNIANDKGKSTVQKEDIDGVEKLKGDCKEQDSQDQQEDTMPVKREELQDKNIRRMPRRKVKPNLAKKEGAQTGSSVKNGGRASNNNSNSVRKEKDSKDKVKDTKEAKATRKQNRALKDKTTNLKSKQQRQVDDKFLQTDPCYTIVPKNIMCLECRRVRPSNTNGGTVEKSKKGKVMWDDFCRFFEFRKLRNCLQNDGMIVAGFSDCTDVTEEDKELWLPKDKCTISKINYEVAKFIISKIGDHFCGLVMQERAVKHTYDSVDGRDCNNVIWKRAVKGMRELCDVCSTTLFNFHHVCERCGFVVCIDCHKTKSESLSLTAIKESVTSQDDKMIVDPTIDANEDSNSKLGSITQAGDSSILINNNNNNNNGSEFVATTATPAKKKKKDACGWLYCAKNMEHNPDKMILAQIIAGNCLEEVWSMLHEARVKLNLGVCQPCKDITEPDDSPRPMEIDDVSMNDTEVENVHPQTDFLDENEDTQEATFSEQVSAAIDCCISSLSNGTPASNQDQKSIHPMTNVRSQSDDHSASFNVKLEKDMKREKDSTSFQELDQKNDEITVSSYLCEGDLLVLEEPSHVDNVKVFREHWQHGKPVLVRNVHKKMNMNHWMPHYFAKEFGDYRSDLVDCRNGDIHRHSMKKYWEGFEPAQNNGTAPKKKVVKDEVLPSANNEGLSIGQPLYYSGSALWRLKDWPPGQDFKDILPSHYEDFMTNLPLQQYTTRSGELNLACRLPSQCLMPDLGPKMYCAYGTAEFPERGTTNLHLDISDAINVMIYVGGATAYANGSCEVGQNYEKAIDNCHIDVKMRKVIKKRSLVPGALWHIFNPKDVTKIRIFLDKVAEERNISPQGRTDPIHDQTWYLDQTLLDRLEREHGVKSYPILHCMGDAILIPAGAPHQVKNVQNCIKVANDFVSPENVKCCLQLTNEFRTLPETHINQEDKLQIKNILYHSVKDSLEAIKAHDVVAEVTEPSHEGAVAADKMSE